MVATAHSAELAMPKRTSLPSMLPPAWRSLGLAGSLVTKKIVPASAGTFPTTGPLWVGLLLGVILIEGGLVYFPALALGPLVEHFQMLAGKVF